MNNNVVNPTSTIRSEYYIAYGSNLNLSQMKRRCPNARFVSKAILKGYRLMFKGSKTGNYLTIEKDSSSKVPVAIFRVTRSDEEALDHYEGFPFFYYKKYFRAEFKDHGREIVETAFAYIMHEDRPFGLPSGVYLDVCREGYRNVGFDPAYLKGAVEYTDRMMKQNRK